MAAYSVMKIFHHFSLRPVIHHQLDIPCEYVEVNTENVFAKTFLLRANFLIVLCRHGEDGIELRFRPQRDIQCNLPIRQQRFALHDAYQI